MIFRRIHWQWDRWVGGWVLVVKVWWVTASARVGWNGIDGVEFRMIPDIECKGQWAILKAERYDGGVRPGGCLKRCSARSC